MRARRDRRQDPLAGFEDVTPLAEGATATVLAARDTVSGSRVAIKLLGVGDGEPDHASFEREARALGAISRHPNVVTLHRAVLPEDGRPMLVLERCERSLADHLTEEGPLPPERVVAAGIALAGALETAHRAGIVHGDLKPQNVLVTRYGEHALADFGIAALRAAAGSDEARPAGVTVLHAAPEVLTGGVPVPASDVYGLASTLVELLTGHPPFGAAGDADAVRHRVLHDPAPAISRPGTPAALGDLLVRALAKDPAARPASPLAFAQELRAIERAAGWGPTACRVGGAEDPAAVAAWATPDGPGTVAAQLGRAAATTGLPPLHLVRPGTPATETPPAAAPPPAPAPPAQAPAAQAPAAQAPAAEGAEAQAPAAAVPDQLPPLWEDAPRRPLHETITFGTRPASRPATDAGDAGDRAVTRRRRWRRGGHDDGDADRS